MRLVRVGAGEGAVSASPSRADVQCGRFVIVFLINQMPGFGAFLHQFILFSDVPDMLNV